MAEETKIDQPFFLVAVGLLGWAIPGGGHFLVGERKRGLSVFCLNEHYE